MGVTNKMGPPGYHVKLDYNLGLFCIFSGCRLGGNQYEVGERWNPRLDPRGIMFCVICECQPVSKMFRFYINQTTVGPYGMCNAILFNKFNTRNALTS